MLIKTLSIILFLIFAVLSSFHFYWFFGGKWGLEKVIPSKGKTAASLRIPKFATLVVALGLLSFGVLYLLKAGFLSVQIPSKVLLYGSWIIPAIFLLRAIGEFNYVGFFKKVKDTEFAKTDTKIFAPLCFFIGLSGIIIQLIS